MLDIADSGGVNRIKFVTFAAIPYIVPSVQTELRGARCSYAGTGSFIFVMGKERADFAAVSALSLPQILT